jgi:tetratricopeptide (TPR) repeat protein
MVFSHAKRQAGAVAPERSYYLSTNRGDAVGPLPQGHIECLLADGLIDASTPLSLDGLRFSPLGPLLSPRDGGAQPTGGASVSSKSSRPASAVESPEPLQSLLVYSKAAYSGRVDLGRGDRSLSIYYRSGRIIMVAPSTPEQCFPAWLERSIPASREAFREAARISQASEQSFATAVIGRGLLAPHLLLEAMHDWTKTTLASWLTERCVIREVQAEIRDTDLLCSFGLYEPYLDIIRTLLPVDYIESRLRKQQLDLLIPAAQDGFDESQLGLKPREQRILRQINGLRTVKELLDTLGEDESIRRETLATLFLLTELGLVAFHSNPELLRLQEQTLRAQKKLETLQRAQPHEILEVKKEATDTDIKQAYQRYARQFHPDFLPAGAPEAMKDCHTRVFVLVADAVRALETAELRSAYWSTRDQQNNQHAQDRNAEGVLRFQKGEVLMRLKKYPNAVVELEQAVACSPENRNYQASLLLALYRRDHLGKRNKDAAVELIRSVKKLSSAAQPEATVEVCLAELQKDAGHLRAAMASYERALSADPSCAAALNGVELILPMLKRGAT